MPALHVLKFGGSSLGRPERFAQVVRIVERVQGGSRVALVVSAFGDTTDHLLAAIAHAESGRRDEAHALIARIAEAARVPVVAALGDRALPQAQLDAAIDAVLGPLEGLLDAVALLREASPRARDEVLSFGERLSSRVVSLALSRTGIPSVAVDARTWIVTDATFGDARVDFAATRARAQALAAEWLDEGAPITVHTGFLGATPDGITTTLGRNGSDYTAAVLAASLDAEDVTLWTDVPGIMTADPALVPDAYPVPRLSHREALELAGLGLRMLHPRTVLPLAQARIPLRIKDTLHPEAAGTLVDADGSDDEARPTCVASLSDMALIDVEGSLGSVDAHVDARVSAALLSAGIPVSLAVSAARGSGLAFVVEGSRADLAASHVDRALEKERAQGLVSSARTRLGMSVVTLVAEAMGRAVNVSGTFFGAIGAIGVNIRASSQGATSRAISCVVAAEDTRVAVQAVHAAFNLAATPINVVLLGKGTVGGNLLSQLASARETLRATHELDVRLVGLVDSRNAVFDERGLAPAEAVARLESAEPRPDDLGPLLDRLRKLPVPVLVDCTAADAMSTLYEGALARGIHVVMANKKALTASQSSREALFRTARSHHRSLRYETTVGAALPVIATLQDMVRTGDSVRRIEASLSGTLGYLSNEVSRGTSLSNAIRAARAHGYTEPHPRDDLAGVDAARKALILAREIGLALEMSDVEVEPFVPAELLEHDDIEAFLSAIAAHDAEFGRQMAGVRAEGRVLRYLARIEVSPTPRLRVGPVMVDGDHPSARLRGTEAQVAFYTDRYAETPLVVQGAGAGGAVTASGVLADVLAVARGRRVA